MISKDDNLDIKIGPSNAIGSSKIINIDSIWSPKCRLEFWERAVSNELSAPILMNIHQGYQKKIMKGQLSPFTQKGKQNHRAVIVQKNRSRKGFSSKW